MHCVSESPCKDVQMFLSYFTHTAQLFCSWIIRHLSCIILWHILLSGVTSVIVTVYLHRKSIIFTCQQQSGGLTQHLTKLAQNKLISLRSYERVFVRVHPHRLFVHVCLCVHAFNMTICAG